MGKLIPLFQYLRLDGIRLLAQSLAEFLLSLLLLAFFLLLLFLLQVQLLLHFSFDLFLLQLETDGEIGYRHLSKLVSFLVNSTERRAVFSLNGGRPAPCFSLLDKN